MLGSTFVAGMSSAALKGLLRVGQAAPVVGEVFGLLASLKSQADMHADAAEENRRLSVWCHSIMVVLSRIVNDPTYKVDARSKPEFAAVARNLRELNDLVKQRRENSKGLVGKMVAFFTSSEYLKKVDTVQRFLDKAIQALILNVSSDTRADVKLVLDKVGLLPKMDQKLDKLLAMAEEGNKKLDKVLPARPTPSAVPCTTPYTLSCSTPHSANRVKRNSNRTFSSTLPSELCLHGTEVLLVVILRFLASNKRQVPRRRLLGAERQ